MAKIYEPKPHELRGARKHILYEVRMLNAAVSAREDLARDRRDPCIGSAFTDSALLHARALYYFLAEDPRKDDIVAGHYIRINDVPWKSTKLEFVQSLIDDINKFRSHLTYSRIKLPRKSWPLVEIKDEINKAFEEFIQLLPDSERPLWQNGNKP